MNTSSFTSYFGKFIHKLRTQESNIKRFMLKNLFTSPAFSLCPLRSSHFAHPDHLRYMSFNFLIYVLDFDWSGSDWSSQFEMHCKTLTSSIINQHSIDNWLLFLSFDSLANSMNCVRIKLWSCISWTWLGRRWRRERYSLVLRLCLYLHIFLHIMNPDRPEDKNDICIFYLYLKLIYNSSSFLQTMIKQMINPSRPRVEIRMIKTFSINIKKKNK